MIIRTVRDDGYEKHDFGAQKKSPEAGVFSILKYELAFGGQVTHFDHYDMVVTTPVFGKTDYIYVHFDSEYERDMMAWLPPSTIGRRRRRMLPTTRN